jgi:hypothetical protein
MIKCKNLTKKSILIIIAVIGVVLFSVLGYAIWANTQNVTVNSEKSVKEFGSYNGWRTHTDAANGFSLRYPTKWVNVTYQDASKLDHMVFLSTTESTAGVDTAVFTSSLSAMDYFNENNPGVKILVSEELKISGKDAVYLRFSPTNDDGVILQNYLISIKGKIVSIFMAEKAKNGSTVVDNAAYVDQFKLIAKSFKM